MNLGLFFEGTGQGTAGRATNVTRLRGICEEDGRQKLHSEAGAGTRFGSYLGGSLAGTDWRAAFRSARRWFESAYETLPADASGTSVYLFGFSRGALLARHFAAWLDRLGVAVAFMGLWDTVDSTAGLDVSEECPPNVAAARHAVARDETRRFFGYVPLRGGKAEEMLFPGSHSDVGGLYEDCHLVADLSLAWIADGAAAAGLRLKKDARLAREIDKSAVKLHDAHGAASNLWGAAGRVERDLRGLRLHPACEGL